MRVFVVVLALLPILVSAAHSPPGSPDEYYDILGSGHKEWRYVFRGTAHTRTSMYSAYTSGNGIPYTVEDGCKTTNWSAPCNNHWRNDDAFNHWDNIQEVLYGIIDDGMLVKVLRFKGVGTSLRDWMTHDRLIDSCWEDLKDATPNFFGIDGDAGLQRRFFINNNYGGCPNDAGWTVVVDRAQTNCAWERKETWPYIMYVPGQKYENLNTDKIRSADSVVVFLKYVPGQQDEYFDLFNAGSKDWRLAFRGTAKVGQPSYPAYRDGTGIKSTVEAGCKTTEWGAPCTSHWRNDEALDNWRDIDQVLLSVIHNGEMVKTIFFTGESTTYLNWLAPQYYYKSCWADVLLQPHNYFSIEGDNGLNRRFFINRNYGGCDNDAGWLVVSDQPPKPCPWEVSTAYPVIKFSASPRYENYIHGEVLEAEAFAIFLKYKQH